ncbi:MAG: hypothetical protein S4CHLAM7_11640 [Chlamydiae bacterium]|nr:hypothetical protein [Chlamydiota bacterium]
MENKYLILAYYHFFKIENPELFVKEHKFFFKDRDVTGRIYISSEGINGQMSGFKKDCEAYMLWLKSQKGFEQVTFKVDPHHQNIFYKMTVKEREQLVAFDQKVDLSQTGTHLNPKEWDEVLENEDYFLIDVRNNYEMEVGHFKTAELPPCETFREFSDYTEKKLLPKKEELENKKILMYCTGGIRCEYYSAYLSEKGFKNVYQLDGGVLNYNHKVGKGHWTGKLFVFDDRLACKVGESDECISTCHHCSEKSDRYYNCANMDCNFLFTCCTNCLETYQGCCKETCTASKRLRPFNHVQNTPFRRWYHYMDEAEKLTK